MKEIKIHLGYDQTMDNVFKWASQSHHAISTATIISDSRFIFASVTVVSHSQVGTQ